MSAKAVEEKRRVQLRACVLMLRALQRLPLDTVVRDTLDVVIAMLDEASK